MRSCVVRDSGPHNCQKKAIMGHPCNATQRNEVQEIAMYAMIRAGGKQYRAAPGDVIEIEKLPQSSGENVQFDDVLAVSASEGEIAKPAAAFVSGQVVE